MTEFAQLMVSGLLRGTVYALIAGSFWLIYSTTQTFHLAHAVTYSVAGYATYVVAQSAGLPLVLAAVAALVVGASISLAMEGLVYRPLRLRGVSILGIFLASLGLATAGPNILQLLFGPQGRAVPGFPARTFDIAGVTVTALQLSQSAIAAAALVILAVVLGRTRLGRAVNAVRVNPDLARSMGVPATRINLIVFAIGGALVAIAAFFETVNFVAEPNMGLGPVIYGFIGMFIGSITTLKGAAAGGFILGFLLVFSGLFLPQNLVVLLVFVILAAAVVWRPTGLLNQVRV